MIKKLWRLGQAERWRSMVLVFCQWTSAMLVVTILWLAANYISTNNWSLGLLMTVVVQIIVMLAYGIWGVNRLSDRWATSASEELQQRFIGYYLNDQSVDQTQTMQIIHQDLGTIKGLAVFYDTIIPTILQLILTGVVMTITILFVHPITVLIPWLSIVAIVILMGMLQGMGHKKNNSYIKSFNQMGQRFLDDFKGMNTLIMYHRQHLYAKKFAADSENYRQKTMGILIYQLQTLTIMDFCLYGALGWFVLAQGFAVKAGTMEMPAAVLISAIVCVWLIDFRKFGYFIHIFISLLPKINRLFKLIDSDEGREQLKDNQSVTLKLQRIELQGSIAFGDHEILNNSSLSLTKGQLIGLTGPSGSGKSTIAKLLMKQLEMTTSNILVNDLPLSKITREQWWQSIGYLGPEMVLFEGTIEDNLLLGMKSEMDWRQTLKKLNLCDFVYQLPDQFQTMVGEDGSLISPGQKQQLAVARAILADKQAYVFDEITSNIDGDNAKIILAAINQLANDKIVLLITHRLEDIKHLQQVYLLDQQTLVAGSSEELSTQVPAFKRLIDEQNRLISEVSA